MDGRILLHSVTTMIMPWTDIEIDPKTESYWALLDFRVDADDTVLSEHLTMASRIATYTLSIIQIDILVDQVRQKINSSNKA